MPTSIRALLCGVVAVSLLWPGYAAATTIDPLLFEELVLGADFVGVVECDQAGGIVASYKVIESWKGPKAGTRVMIRTAVNYWEPQFPIALCGERYFVTAYKEPPSRVVSTTSGAGVPLWWRDIPADYRLPLFQGRRFLTPEVEMSAEFKDTRKKAQALLALKPAEQEAALMKAVIEKDLFGKRWIGGEPDEEKAKALLAKFAKITGADLLVSELLGLAGDDAKKWGVRVGIVFQKAGRAVTLARLEKLTADKSPWGKDELTELVESVKRHQGAADPPRKPDPPTKDEPPSREKLARLRAAISEGEKADNFGEAFEVLTRHDPGAVAAYLVAWTNPDKDWRDADRGYVLGSYFAWRCGVDRKKHLAALAVAKDPFVRVAGAVYLCYEDVDAGTTLLKKLTALEGDPGVWAALTLARRGHKDEVARALEVFRELPKEQKIERGGMAGVPHRNLQKRVLVLLSNSAQAGAVPPPTLAEDEAKQLDSLVQWWKKHAEKVTPQDPWLNLLEKQKVD
ncbi:MAG: hypothetical protein C0467_24235 [Planctomycetaceae bacterium]|nr:hypothetical protein [Planctomycetaceae bacterium]